MPQKTDRLARVSTLSRRIFEPGQAFLRELLELGRDIWALSVNMAPGLGAVADHYLRFCIDSI